VLRAISKLKLHKDDGDLGLASDYFVYAGPDLSTHVALLFTGIVIHGYVPSTFLSSTVVPIQKNSNVNATVSANYCGIALSSILGKLFDNITSVKYSDRLSNSDLQFGFKQNSSTHMCTMVL